MHQSHQDPRYQYALALRSKNKLAEAIAYLKQQITQQPTYFQGWLLLSRCLYEAGYSAEAVQVCQKAEQFDPLQVQFRDVQFAMQSGHLTEAEDMANVMLEKEHNHPRAVFTLAHIAEYKKDYKRKLDILQEALSFSPANVHFRHMLVGTFEINGDYAGAIACAETLVNMVASPENLWTLLNVLLRYGQNEKVLKVCHKAEQLCARAPQQMSEILLIKGQSLRILGQREQAIEAIQKSLQYNRENGHAWWALADMKNYQFSSEQQHAMQSLLQKPQLPAQVKSVTAFSLAKSFETQGNWQEAMQLYRTANKLKRHPGFKVESLALDIKDIINTYTVDAVAQQKSTDQEQADNEQLVPIFIVGLPRSGSTLIEQILASHSQIEGTMEQPVLANIARQANIMFTENTGTGIVVDPAVLTAEQLKQLGEGYLSQGALFRSNTTPYFTDKQPFNFRHIGLIHKILPKAIIIDVRRNPLDCGLSLYKQHFSSGVDFSYELSDIGVFYNSYLALMDHWHNVLPGKVLTVRYEELIHRPETMTRAILDHVGVEFEETCLSFYNTRREVHTASSEQVRQPINNRSIGVWKKVEDELTALKASLGEASLARFTEYL